MLKHFLACLCIVISIGSSVTTHAQKSHSKTLLIIGDSLSAAYGMDYSKGWTSLLASRLIELDTHWQLVNASISGETSKGGLSRLPKLIETHHPDLVLIELGANDGLRGYPLKQLKGNLQSMIQLSQKNGAQVVLMEMKVPPNYGKRYTSDFMAVYEELATEEDVELVPFFLEKVAEDSRLMMADNIHPNENAQPLLLEAVWATLEKYIKSGES